MELNDWNGYLIKYEELYYIEKKKKMMDKNVKEEMKSTIKTQEKTIQGLTRRKEKVE